MSVKVSAWVWHEATRDIKGNDLVMLLALADVANDRGVCTYFDSDSESSYDGLAEKARIHRSTVGEVISRLKSKGVLEVTRRGPGLTNEYRILIDQESGNPTPKKSGNTTPRIGESRLHTSLLREDVLTADSPSSDTSSDDFETFWMTYPRKVGKGDARNAFTKVTKKVSARLVIEGARRFAADPNLPDPQFVKHPATWLRAESWDDEPLPPRIDRSAPVHEVIEGQEWLSR